jgi:hypothetical protein
MISTETFLLAGLGWAVLAYITFRIGWHYGRKAGREDLRWHRWFYRNELNRRTRI